MFFYWNIDMYFKSKSMEGCEKESTVDSTWECKIASRKFGKLGFNTFEPSYHYRDDRPGGCYCKINEETQECSNTFFNSNLEPSSDINVGTGICRGKGRLSYYYIIQHAYAIILALTRISFMTTKLSY